MKLLSILFSICFLDMIGYAMFAATLSFLFVPGPYNIVNLEENYRHIVLGIMFSTYSFVQIFSSIFWGRIAVSFSKKTVLLISYSGNLLGYLLCSFGVYNKQAIFVFLGIFVAGLLGANMAMINAYISHTCRQENWAKAFSLLGVLVGTAFVLGPELSVLFMKIYPNYNVCLIASLCSAFIAFCNILSVCFFLSDHSKVDGETFQLPRITYIWKTSGTMKPALLLLFCVYFTWYFFVKFYQVFLVERVGLTEMECCHATSFLGFSCMIWQSVRVLFDRPWFQGRNFMGFCSFMLVFALLCFPFSRNIVSVLIITAMVSFCFSFLAPTLLSLILGAERHIDKVYKTSLVQCVQSAGRILSPLVCGFLLGFGHFLPILLAVLLVLSFLIVVFRYSSLFPTSDCPVQKKLEQH